MIDACTEKRPKKSNRRIGEILAIMLFFIARGARAEHSLNIDDVMKLTTLSQVSPSPDGDYVASVVIRPPDESGVYGRTFYELDPARADIWLTSRSGVRRNLTKGAPTAAGFWCATWSPDGQRLAMLSTKPEGSEPRGGDNVRLYIWDRRSDTISRVSDTPIFSQTMGGSPLYKVELRGGAGGDVTHTCGPESNAPFLWLDNNRLLAMAMPKGSTSGLLDAYSRALKQDAETLDKLRAGVEPDVTAVGSGSERVAAEDSAANQGSLVVFDVVKHVSRAVSGIPIYPFRGQLQLFVSPDESKAAVLATTGAIQPRAGEHFAYPYDAWSTEKRLGFVNLETLAPVRWVDDMPKDAPLALDLLAWSPDSQRLAFRAHSDPATRALALFAASPADLGVRRLSPPTISISGNAAGTNDGTDAPVFWIDAHRLIARGVDPAKDLSPWDWYRASLGRIASPRVDWWLLSDDAQPSDLTAGLAKAPTILWRAPGRGRFTGIGNGTLWSIDVTRRRVARYPGISIPGMASLLWSGDPDQPSAYILIAGTKANSDDDTLDYRLIQPGKSGPIVRSVTLPGATATFDDFDAATGTVFADNRTRHGLFVNAIDTATGKSRELLALNTPLADVKWGRTMLVDYLGDEGEKLHAGVILPPDYQPGQKYPTLVWVYAGSIIRNLHDFFLDPYMPGFYNLQLYAAKGYVVLIPSMPLSHDLVRDDYIDLPKGTLPAVSKLVDLGVADPDRLAVMGQSYGGFSVYSLLTYTNRFKAGIAIAGISDLVSDYGHFDPTARGYPGIEHEKSDNWGLAEGGQIGMGRPPYEDMWHYWRNSPLNYVDRVNTPLLMIHGEQDIRGPMSQAEQFFFSLYRQGKTARLLRYWGEGHGLRLSPADTRDIYTEIVAWLDKYIGSKAVLPKSDPQKLARRAVGQ